jgi:hypothetical protein
MEASSPEGVPPPDQATASYQGGGGAAGEPGEAQGALGRFELRAVLGEGSFGRVYRAFDPVLDREVALKVPTFPAGRPDLTERFLREARAAARLRHPNIVAVFETGQADGRFYIASELVAGQPLSARLAAERPDVRRAVEWVRSLALALHYAHEEGVVHRDVKPANIMLDGRGRVQLMDFGLAKRLDPAAPIPLAGEDEAGPADAGPADAGLTREGSVLGTPAYMAPEQARGDLEAVGPHSDQYSLGVVLYELLTGKRPFRGPLARLRRRVADPGLEPAPPQELNPEVPPALGAVCLKALAKAPGRRYASAADFAVDLQRWLNGQPVSAWRRPRPPRPAARRWGSPRRLAWALAGLVAVLAAAGTAAYFIRLWTRLDEAAEAAAAAAEEAKRQALAKDCDLARERGLRLRAEGRTNDGLLWLARSFALAADLADERRLRAAAGGLGEDDWPLPSPPGLAGEARRGWRLAGSLLLGLRLDQVADLGPYASRLPHGGPARSTGFAADGRVLSAGRGPGLRDASTGEPFGPPEAEGACVFGPDGRRAVCMGTVWTVLDLTRGAALGPRHNQDWALGGAAFSPDGARLVVWWRERRGDRPPLAQVWDPLTVQPRSRAVSLTGLEHHRGPAVVLVSADGKTVASLAHERAALWDFEATDRGGVPVRSIRPVQGSGRPLPGRVTGLAFHPDGRRLAVSTGAEVRLLDPETLEGDLLLEAPGVMEMQFSPDGRQLLARGADGFRLWDVRLGRPVGLPLQQLKGVARVQFRPDGRQILTAADGDARLWPNPLVAADQRGPAALLWAEATTGHALTAEGDVRPLTVAERAERRSRFEQQVGWAP